jgi:hypothetical protein
MTSQMLSWTYDSVIRLESMINIEKRSMQGEVEMYLIGVSCVQPYELSSGLG